MVRGNKSKEASSKNTSEQNRKRAEGQSGDDKDNVNVPVRYSADAVSVENGTIVSVRAFNVSDYHQTELFVRMKQITDPDIPLRDAS